MKKAIIVLDSEKVLKDALKRVLDRHVLDFIVHELKEAGVADVYIEAKERLDIEDTIYVSSLYEAVSSMSEDDGVLIIDDIYPYITSGVWEKMFEDDKVRIKDTKIIKVDIKDLIKGDKITFEEIEASDIRKIDTPEAYTDYLSYIYDMIRAYHSANGVILLDPKTTYIGPEVKIAKGVTIAGNTCIYGDSFIGEDTIIESGSFLENVKIGTKNKIISSRITDSLIHDHNTIGPYAHLRDHSEVMDHCRIGNFVEFKKTTFGDYSRCAHLTYLGDTKVGKDVNIGCGVVTVNYDGAHKYQTEIKDHAFVGSNSNLVAPITIGEYALVAAGSTVTKDVKDHDMAIARPFETVKEGYGYVYITKEK